MRFTNCPECGANQTIRRDGQLGKHRRGGGSWCEGGASLTVADTTVARAIEEGRPLCPICGRPVMLNRMGEIAPHQATGGVLCDGKPPAAMPAAVSPDRAAYEAAQHFGYAIPMVHKASPAPAPRPPKPARPAHPAPRPKAPKPVGKRFLRLSCGHTHVAHSTRERDYRRCRTCHQTSRVLGDA